MPTIVVPQTSGLSERKESLTTRRFSPATPICRLDYLETLVHAGKTSQAQSEANRLQCGCGQAPAAISPDARFAGVSVAAQNKFAHDARRRRSAKREDRHLG